MRIAARSVLHVLLVLGVGAAACSGSVTAPGGALRTFAGEWIGSTSQGAAIAFSVSAQNVVTAITIGRDFNGCPGVQAFKDLMVVIGEPGSSGRVPTASAPEFGFGSGPPDGPDFVQLVGQFTSSQSAEGTAIFLNFGTCGNAVAHWTATKR